MSKRFFSAPQAVRGGLISLLIFGLALSFFAQTAGTGALTGTVKDSSGA